MNEAKGDYNFLKKLYKSGKVKRQKNFLIKKKTFVVLVLENQRLWVFSNCISVILKDSNHLVLETTEKIFETLIIVFEWKGLLSISTTVVSK